MNDVHAIDDPAGTITVPATTLAHVVIRAAEEVDGVKVRRPRRGLEVDVEGGRARVSLDLSARYGTVLPRLAEDVQRNVAGALSGMCGLDVESVDVAVEELELDG